MIEGCGCVIDVAPVHAPAATGSFMVSAPCSHLWGGSAEAGAGAMLVACRLAGLSALILDYAVKAARAQFGSTQRSSGHRGQRAEDMVRPTRRIVGRSGREISGVSRDGAR